METQISCKELKITSIDKTIMFATRCLTEGSDLLITGGVASGKLNTSVTVGTAYAGKDQLITLVWKRLISHDFLTKMPVLEKDDTITWLEAAPFKEITDKGKYALVIDFDDITSINQMQEDYLLLLLSKRNSDGRLILCGLPELVHSLPKSITTRLTKINIHLV